MFDGASVVVEGGDFQTAFVWLDPDKSRCARDLLLIRKIHNKTDQAQKVLSSFHSVLIEMKARSVITADPAEKVTLRPNAREKEPVKIPTIEEFQALLAAADKLANAKNSEISAAWERYRPMIYLAADSGMRPQEYLALPPEGLHDRGVKVLQALDRSNRIGPPKTCLWRIHCYAATGSC